MKMKPIIIVTLLLVSSFVWGQQTAQFSQYYTNPYIINPASGGMTKTINVDLGYRKQWVGINGSPQTFYGTAYSEINFDHRVKVLDTFNTVNDFIYETPSNSVGMNKHVIGGSVYYDEIGPFQQANVMASYAFHLRFASKSMVSFGVSAGYSNFGINSSRIVLLQQDDHKYDDFLLNSANQSTFDLNAGITFYSEQYQFGISTMHLAGNKIKFRDVDTHSQYARHWFIYGMYDFKLKDNLSLEPHFLFQMTKNTPVAFDIGARLHIERKYWVNLGYRLQDAISIGAGLNLGRNLSLGYSYDISVGKVQRLHNSVHEIVLGLTFGSNRVVETAIFDDESL